MPITIMGNGSALLVAVLVALAVLASCGTSGSELPFGTYTCARSAAGANSLDNLAQMDECIKRNDRDCETAMLLDGRAFLVEEGTSMDGEEVGYRVFHGRVHSGALVGKEVYIPVGVFK
jgi:hypothetical protein